MKDYDKKKKLPYLQYWYVNNLYVRAMLQKLPVKKFEWIKDTFQFNVGFIENYTEESDERCFLKVVVQCFEQLHEIHKNFRVLQEGMKIEKVQNLVVNFLYKPEYVIHIHN